MAIKNLGKVVPQKGIDYFTEEDINSLNIPKKTSDLTNDSSYATETYVKNQIANAQLGGEGGEVDLSGYATKDEIPTKTSQLTNDSSFATETYVNNKIAKIQLNGDIVNANEKGLFSWKHDDITADYEYMAKLCDYLGLTEVYQSFTWNGLDSNVATGINHLKNNTKNNVEVGYLCGEASWYNTTDAQAHIDKITTYNNGVGENAKITKFLLDVEPWTLSLETSEWLNDYVNMITTTHTYANDNNLTFGLVTPFWIDTASKINDETVYKTIIDNCDEVYVMNYNRNTYDDAIDNEVAYCKLSNKPIYSIAETQAPNEENGVTDNLTYYNVGLDELNDNWQELKDKYNYSNLNFAYHDYRAMKILIPTIPSGYATKDEIPTKTSELENDNKFITKEDVEIPVATNTILGGVMPVSKNDSMSQRVGVDASGSLWTAPGASGTLLVAASDAPDTIKNAAQYVCTGVNDQLVINSAIVEVGKGEVRLSGGNYYTTGEIKLLDDITLTGRNSIINVCDEISSLVTQSYTGGDTIIYVEDASKFVVGQKVSTDSNINSKYDCHIIAIDTEANTVTLDKNLSSSNGFEANKYKLVADFTAVSCYEKENVIIDGVIVNSNGETYTRYDTVLGCNGIELYNSNNCKIINCTVKDTRTHGIAIFGSTACSVLNTRVENCYELGIDLSNGQNGEGGHSIVSCTVSGCKGRGIQIHYGKRVNVVACVLSGNAVGLGTQGSGQEVIVTGCNICDNNTDGIYCNVSPGKNIIVADNIISNNNNGAIQIDAVEDISITGNTIFHNKNYGVKVLKTSNFVIANNKLYDNCYDDTATEIKTNAAIAMSNACSYGLVTGNNIEINATETKGCACGIAENNMLGDYNVVTNNLIVGARIQATRKLGTNSKFENNYEF